MSTLPANVFTAMLALAGLLAAPGSVRAAESYDNCTGFIDSIPTVITTQGTWCLRKDLNTALSGISAIDIQANNVTIDCNDFKIGGLAAGPSTYSTGIYAYGQRSNITVRHCAIRGFRWGIAIYGNDPGTGHLVEDNRLDNNTTQGIYVIGDGSVVQRNRVLDTGGAPGSGRADAISVLGDVIDNVVDGIAAAGDVANFSSDGIYAGGFGGITGVGFLVRGNRVRNLEAKGTGTARGISVAGNPVMVSDNMITQYAPTNGIGVYCSTEGIIRNNTITRYSQPTYGGCADGGGNIQY